MVTFFQAAQKVAGVGYICLADRLVNSHYHVMKTTERLTWYAQKRYLQEEDIPIVKDILCQISDQVVEAPPIEEQKERIMSEIDEACKYIDPGDEEEMTSIARGAVFYASDDCKADLDTFRRVQHAKALYEKGLTKPDSAFSRYFMELAVEEGVLWIVQFLHAQGVPVDLQSIDWRVTGGFSDDYVAKIKARQDIVKQYLSAALDTPLW